MKKLSIFASGAVLVFILIAAAWSDSRNNSRQSDQQTVEQEGEVESGVSQSQIDTVKKREAARAQRDRKLKIRARNVRQAPMGNDSLFRSSR